MYVLLCQLTVTAVDCLFWYNMKTMYILWFILGFDFVTDPMSTPDKFYPDAERMALAIDALWIRIYRCITLMLIRESIALSSPISLLKMFQHSVAVLFFILSFLTRFNKIATQGAPQMAVDKEANSLSRVYSYYSKFTLCLFYV